MKNYSNYLNLFFLAIPFLFFAKTEPDHLNKDANFLKVVDFETELIIKMIDFNDQNLLNSFFDGTYLGTLQEADLIFAKEVLCYNDMDKYLHDFNNMIKAFNSLIEIRDDFSQFELENLLNEEIFKRISRIKKICDQRAAICHRACISIGGSGNPLGVGLIYACHANCAARQFVCNANHYIAGDFQE